MNGVNLLFVISCIFIPLLLISINYESINNFYNYSAPLNKMLLWEDPFFNDPDKFIETSEKKGSTCFITSSMNNFCYAKPIIYEDGIPRTSIVIGENGISGELHFDSINEVYAAYFNADTAPARETVEVANLPKFVNVEISVIAMK